MNLWDHYRGQIVYLVLDEEKQVKLIKQATPNLLGFSFGDSPLLNGVCVSSIHPGTIEMMSAMMDVIIGQVDNILISDAYIMQAKNPTAMSKGAAIKGFLSNFKAPVRKSNMTIIFASEGEDRILRRNFAKFA